MKEAQVMNTDVTEVHCDWCNLPLTQGQPVVFTGCGKIYHGQYELIELLGVYCSFDCQRKATRQSELGTSKLHIDALIL